MFKDRDRIECLFSKIVGYNYKLSVNKIYDVFDNSFGEAVCYDDNGMMFYPNDKMLYSCFILHSKGKNGNQAVKPSCTHTWQTYHGLKETYDYCTICDIKQDKQEAS